MRTRLASYLTREGFRVVAVDGAAAVRDVVRRERVDLALVDLAMPGEDGLSLTRYLRENGDIGIIILTGKRTPVDRVIGLEIGADDYVAKPFHLRELLARIRSVLRRTGLRPAAEPRPDPAVLRFSGWRLDLAKRRLTSARNKAVHLTAGEFQLLSALLANPNQVISRDRLLEIIAARRWNPDDRAVDQHISRLRHKIEKDPRQPQLIRSIRGKGYVFTGSVVRER